MPSEPGSVFVAAQPEPARLLLEYFAPRCRALTVLELPGPGEGSWRPRVTRLKDGVFASETLLPSLAARTGYVRLKARDVTALVLASLRHPGRQDLFVGSGALAGMCAGWLKRMGKARVSVYHAWAWSARRHPGAVRNRISVEMDRAACLLADHIWNPDADVERARREVLRFDPTHFGRQHSLEGGELALDAALAAMGFSAGRRA